MLGRDVTHTWLATRWLQLLGNRAVVTCQLAAAVQCMLSIQSRYEPRVESTCLPDTATVEQHYNMFSYYVGPCCLPLCTTLMQLAPGVTHRQNPKTSQAQ
jgi:hypothetical protein